MARYHRFARAELPRNLPACRSRCAGARRLHYRLDRRSGEQAGYKAAWEKARPDSRRGFPDNGPKEPQRARNLKPSSDHRSTLLSQVAVACSQDYAQGIMPRRALIKTAAMPTGIAIFQPMFISWS